MLFDWLIVGQVVASNPAAAVRGPKHSVVVGSTPVLSAPEARALLDSISGLDLVSLRDRALIGLMIYSFARIEATISLRQASLTRPDMRMRQILPACSLLLHLRSRTAQSPHGK